MRRNSARVEFYLQLWNTFESLLEKRGLELFEFANNWDKFDHLAFSDKEMNQKKFYDRLRNSQSNKDKLTRVQEKSIEFMKEYIRFIEKDFTIQELHPDEGYENWFE